MFIRVEYKSNKYRLFVEDLKKIYRMPQKSTPKLPVYEPDRAKKWEELTSI